MVWSTLWYPVVSHLTRILSSPDAINLWTLRDVLINSRNVSERYVAPRSLPKLPDTPANFSTDPGSNDACPGLFSFHESMRSMLIASGHTASIHDSVDTMCRLTRMAFRIMWLQTAYHTALDRHTVRPIVEKSGQDAQRVVQLVGTSVIQGILHPRSSAMRRMTPSMILAGQEAPAVMPMRHVLRRSAALAGRDVFSSQRTSGLYAST